MRRYLLLIAVLALITYGILWHAFPKHALTNELAVSVLNVGQGDAIYVRAPDGSDMLIDGGPRGKLLSPLQKVMPFDDKSVDVLVVTNPDIDHYAGFIDLLSEYEVGALIEPGTHSSTKTYKEFESLVAEKKIPKVLARRGMRVLLDQEHGISYEILFPDRDVSDFKTNDGSIVGKLSFGTRSFLFTGDSTSYTESLLLADQKELLKSDVLKVGHHGSRTSTSSAFLDAVHPLYAIISAGQKNKYGHPHPEILRRLAGIEVLGTYKTGTITCTTNGTALLCN